MRAVFLDLETNGLDPWVHVPVEVALRIVDLNTGRRLHTFHSLVGCSDEEWLVSDPESLRIHGLSEEQLKRAPHREEVGQVLLGVLNEYGIRRGEAVFICQNPSFDRAFFSRLIAVRQQELGGLPYHWLDFASMFWAIYVKDRQQGAEVSFAGFSKDKIAHVWGLPPEEQPHRALNGVDHLLLCYEHVVGWPEK